MTLKLLVFISLPGAFLEHSGFVQSEPHVNDVNGSGADAEVTARQQTLSISEAESVFQ